MTLIRTALENNNYSIDLTYASSVSDSNDIAAAIACPHGANNTIISEVAPIPISTVLVTNLLHKVLLAAIEDKLITDTQELRTNDNDYQVWTAEKNYNVEKDEGHGSLPTYTQELRTNEIDSLVCTEEKSYNVESGDEGYDSLPTYNANLKSDLVDIFGSPNELGDINDL